MLTDVEGGAQQDRFVGGSQAVAIRVAEELGDRVVLGAPVARIAHGAGRRASSRAGAAEVRRAARDRRGPAAAARRGSSSTRPAPRARAARPADAAGLAGQGDRGLRRAVLARRRPLRRGAQRGGAGDDDLRQLAARRLARRPGRLRRRRATRARSPARQVGAPPGRARLLRVAVRAAGAQAAERYIEQDWARGARGAAAGRSRTSPPAAGPRPGPPCASRSADPLGRDRDRDPLVRLHRRRGQLRRARRGRGAGAL